MNSLSQVYQDMVLPFPCLPSTDRALKKKASENYDREETFNRHRLAVDSKTVRDYSHSYGRQIASQGFWLEGTEIEVARVPSYRDHLTFLRKIDTWVGTFDGRPILRWELNNFWKIIATWRLYYTPLPGGERLEWRRMGPGYGPADSMPYSPVYPLHKWNDNRFLWNNSEDIQVPLLPGYNVSLICQLLCYVPATYLGNREHFYFSDWESGINYKKGDIVKAPEGSVVDGYYLACIYDHLSPGVYDNYPWSTIQSVVADDNPSQYSLSVAGRLSVSRQSEGAYAGKSAKEQYF